MFGWIASKHDDSDRIATRSEFIHRFTGCVNIIANQDSVGVMIRSLGVGTGVLLEGGGEGQTAPRYPVNLVERRQEFGGQVSQGLPVVRAQRVAVDLVGRVRTGSECVVPQAKQIHGVLSFSPSGRARTTRIH